MNYNNFYLLNKAKKDLESVIETLGSAVVEPKLKETEKEIEAIEKKFKGKGYYNNMVFEILYTYEKDIKFREEIKKAVKKDKYYKAFLFNELVVYFSDSINYDRTFSKSLFNIRLECLEKEVKSAKEKVSNLTIFLKELDDAEFVMDMLSETMKVNKAFFSVFNLNRELCEFFVENKQYFKQ